MINILIFALEHRLLLLVRTASMSKYKKNNVNPYTLQDYYIKLGVRGSKLHGHVSMM